MKHIPYSSRIFIGILIITMLITYIALHFATYVADYTLRNSPELRSNQHEQEVKAKQRNKLDTSDWKSYEDKTYPLTFLYPKTWTTKSTVNEQEFYDIVLNPGAKFYDIHIYVSTDGYYGLEGLKQTPILIGNRQGFSASENLAGIKVGEYYYTFDGSMNTTQADEFYTLLDTVKFE